MLQGELALLLLKPRFKKIYFALGDAEGSPGPRASAGLKRAMVGRALLGPITSEGPDHSPCAPALSMPNKMAAAPKSPSKWQPPDAKPPTAKLKPQRAIEATVTFPEHRCSPGHFDASPDSSPPKNMSEGGRGGHPGKALPNRYTAPNNLASPATHD